MLLYVLLCEEKYALPLDPLVLYNSYHHHNNSGTWIALATTSKRKKRYLFYLCIVIVVVCLDFNLPHRQIISKQYNNGTINRPFATHPLKVFINYTSERGGGRLSI